MGAGTEVCREAAGVMVLFVPMAGALAVTLAAAGSVRTMMGLGQETVEELNTFSKALLPTLSAAVAASGGILSASVRQVATVFFVDLVCLLPLVRLGTQYLVYKAAAFLAGVLGAERLTGRIDALGGAFGLIFGMTGACGLLLLISISSALGVVTG